MNYRIKSKRGIALVLLLFVMVILLTLTMGLASIATTDNQVAHKHFYNKKVFNLARSGLIRASAELKTNENWGSAPVKHEFGENGKDGSYTVSVTYETTTDGRGYWQVTSVGELGEYKRTLQAWLELESFSNYLYLTDTEVGNVGGAYYTIWYTGDDVLDGPVHTNGYFSIYQNPEFSEKVSSANVGDSFYNEDDRTYNQGGYIVTDPAKFYHCYSGYTSDFPVASEGSPDFVFNGGSSVAEFPGGVDEIANHADVTVTGNVEYLRFSANGTVEIKPEGESAYAVSTEKLTLHVDGDIKDVYGKVKGKVTIASTNDISISKDITYHDKEVDLLGIVASNNVVINTPSDKQRDMEIDASIMAVNGSFYVDGYDQGVDRGVLTIFGSVVQKRRGPVGTFTTTGIHTGYHKKDYHFDQRLSFLRPPNYPHTGRVVVKSFRDRAALGGNDE